MTSAHSLIIPKGGQYEIISAPSKIISNHCQVKVRQSRNDFFKPRILPKIEQRILLYYYDNPVWLVLVRFLEEIEDTKKTFRNWLTFSNDNSPIIVQDRKCAPEK